MESLQEWPYYFFYVVEKNEIIFKMNYKILPNQLLLKNGKIIDPLFDKIYKGDILIDNGRVENPSKQTKKTKIIDCSGKIITHGFCDIHSHFREPGREDKETLESGSLSAMAGGFTRVCVMPNTNPPIDTPELIDFILKKSKKYPLHIHPIGAVTKNQNGKNLTEMGLMSKQGAVAFSDDGLPIQNGKIMRMALEYTKPLDLPIINHAEDVYLRSDGLMHEGFISTNLGLPGNPDFAESIMIHRDLELASFTGSKIHIPHVSSQKSVVQISKFKTQYKNISSEVTPHHLYFNDEALRSFDTNFKVAPPIRTENDRLSLIEGLKKGIIDCIATDHAPHTLEEKETTFDLASCGMIGLESCFGAVNKVLVHQNNFKLMSLIKLLTINPRSVMRFDSNLFRPKKTAEIVILDEKKKWMFTRDSIMSNSSNSPFIGEELIGRIEFTISKNHIYSRTRLDF